MSTLLNDRHEAFCQAHVRGLHAGNAVASCEAASYRPDASSASRVVAYPHIRQRIAGLTAENAAGDWAAAEAYGVTRASVIVEMKKFAFAAVSPQ